MRTPDKNLAGSFFLLRTIDDSLDDTLSVLALSGLRCLECLHGVIEFEPKIETNANQLKSNQRRERYPLTGE